MMRARVNRARRGAGRHGSAWPISSRPMVLQRLLAGYVLPSACPQFLTMASTLFVCTSSSSRRRRA